MLDYLNLNGIRGFLRNLYKIFLTKSDAHSTYLKKTDLNFVNTTYGVEIHDGNGNVIYKIPVMKG